MVGVRFVASAVLLIALAVLLVADAEEDYRRRGVYVTTDFLINLVLVVCALVVIFT